MIPINLLPHREARRKAQQRQFLFLTGGAMGIGVVLVVLVHGFAAGACRRDIVSVGAESLAEKLPDLFVVIGQ
jgi:hypothetical protein